VNGNNTDFQVPPEEDGVMREETTSGAPPRDDPETQSALTGFVGRERLTYDPLRGN